MKLTDHLPTIESRIEVGIQNLWWVNDPHYHEFVHRVEDLAVSREALGDSHDFEVADDRQVVHNRFVTLQGSPWPTIMTLIAKGQKIEALYFLRYHQDYGMTWHEALPLVLKACDKNADLAERAEATPGIAVSQRVRHYQEDHGLIPRLRRE